MFLLVQKREQMPQLFCLSGSISRVGISDIQGDKVRPPATLLQQLHLNSDTCPLHPEWPPCRPRGRHQTWVLLPSFPGAHRQLHSLDHIPKSCAISEFSWLLNLPGQPTNTARKWLLGTEMTSFHLLCWALRTRKPPEAKPSSPRLLIDLHNLLELGSKLISFFCVTVLQSK